MNWDMLDFAVFGALLGAVVIAGMLTVQFTGNRAYRYAVAIALVAAFMLVWVNGAVGIIGNENNDANMLFFGVPAVALAAAALARFRPGGMAAAMTAAALTQVLLAVVAVAGGWGEEGPAWPMDVLVLTVFFTTLWLTSAGLFRKAAEQRSREPGKPEN